MLETVKKRITLTKGDDGSVWLRPRYKDKSIYTVQEGDRAFFRINATKSVVEIECNVNVDANKIVVSFVPNDTKDLAPGIYRYEAELITSWGMHYTFLANETFILGAEIEKHISNANSNGNYGNNIPSVDGEIEDEPIVDGDIQPTNPSLDYETLNHLPKVNGNTLIGDKSNEQLGIPTKLSEMDNDDNYVQDEDYQHTDNNYDNTAKDIVDGVTDALATKVDKIPGKGLSTNDYTDTDKSKLNGIETGAEVNVQADWNGTDSSADDYIKNKPTLGTAAAKNYTSQVASGSTDLVESGAVKTAIDNAVASSYHHAGVKTCAELVSSLLIAANQGNVYNITDDGVTTADFIEGAGIPIKAGDNVGIAKVGSAFKFDLLSGFIDTSNFVEKSATSGLIRNDGSIDESDYALESEIPDISGKAEKSEMAITTNGDKTTIQLKSGLSAQVLNAHQDISGKANKSEMFITDGTGADADKTTIQLKDGLSKAVLTAHQDISGKAEKSEMSVTDGTGTDADKTTIQLKSGTSATVLKTHQDISGKVEKVSGATNGNLAGLDANGNLTDSGIATTDVEEMQDELSIDTSTIEGNPINFTTLSAQKSKSTILSVEPIQDLHGYDKPWVGGAGKNLLRVKKDYTKNQNGITVVTIVDKDGNTLGIDINGTATANVDFFPYETVSASQNSYYITTGLSQEYVGFQLVITPDYSGIKTSRVFNNTSIDGIYCGIKANTVFNHLKIYAMICLDAETDKSYEPYENECPISGRTEIGILGCGKNLFDKTSTLIEGYMDDSGYIVSSGSHRIAVIPCTPNTQYTVSKQAGKRFRVAYTTETPTIGTQFYGMISDHTASSITITTGYNAKYLITWIWWSSDTVTLQQMLDTVQCELGQTVTSYSPYTKSNDLTISLGQTVYGGTLDVENGVLVVDKIYIDLPNLSNKWRAWGSTGSWFTGLSNANHYTSKILSNALTEGSIGDMYQMNQTWRIANNKDYNQLCLALTSAYDTSEKVADFITQYSVHAVLELADAYKTTIQLTPHQIDILQGVNTITTNADNITLTYRNGSVATLSDLISAVDSLDGKIDESKILTDTATGDKYILVVSNGVLSVEQISN